MDKYKEAEELLGRKLYKKEKVMLDVIYNETYELYVHNGCLAMKKK